MLWVWFYETVMPGFAPCSIEVRKICEPAGSLAAAKIIPSEIPNGVFIG